jgi:hypothetical protein
MTAQFTRQDANTYCSPETGAGHPGMSHAMSSVAAAPASAPTAPIVDDLAVCRIVAAWLARRGHPANHRFVVKVYDSDASPSSSIEKLTILPRIASPDLPAPTPPSDEEWIPTPLQLKVLDSCDESPKSRKQLQNIMGARVYSRGPDGVQELVRRGLLEMIDGDKFQIVRE